MRKHLLQKIVVVFDLSPSFGSRRRAGAGFWCRPAPRCIGPVVSLQVRTPMYAQDGLPRALGASLSA